MERQQDNRQPQNFQANADQGVKDSGNNGATLMPPTSQFETSSSAGVVQKQEATAESAQQASSGETWDSHSNRRIAGIHPNVQASAYTFVNRAQAELGIKLRVTSGLRTFSEQDELYAKGRTAPGGRVTNARGGQSYHNYGLAIDVVEITDAGKANWNTDWAAIGALGESVGWEWGGNWTGFVDKPHFQITFGFSTSQLRSMYNAQGGNFVNLGEDNVPVIPETDASESEQEQDQKSDAGSGASVKISGSVGKGGVNQYDDVKLVQTLLNKSGANLAVDGDVGPLTIAAISAYQMGQFGWSDGRVDVSGKTWQSLQSNAAPQPIVYTVKSGDTLSKIADQHKTSVAEILAANPSISNPNLISIGQKITIPPKGGSAPAPAPEAEDPTKEPDTGGGGGSEDSGQGGGTNIIYGSKVSTEFAEKVIQVSSELGINPNYLMAAMAFETGGSFDPAQKNFAGSGATGLIQFMPATARGLGTSTAELAKMTAIEQLDYVKAYFQPYKGKISTLEDLYMAILWPRGIGKSNDYVLWSRGTRAYELNSGLDSNGDGSVTKAEAAGKVRVKYEEGMEDQIAIGAGETEQTNSGGNTGAGENENAEQGGETTTENSNTGGSIPSSANFSITEFDCNDGTPVPEEFYSNVQELMNNLEVLREELDGNSIRVNSGYRTPDYNASVGGASNSQHKYGRAADIVVANYSPSLVHTTIARLIRQGKMKEGGLGSYNTFTHYDIRGTKARW